MTSAAVLDEELTLSPETAVVRQSPNRTPKNNPRAIQIAQTLVLAVLFAVPALRCVHSACVGDPDIWWHLATADWMRQHHAIPHVDPFSGTVGGQPWQPYSWLFELLVDKLFQNLGLAGIVTYTATLLLAITAALHHLIRRLQTDFSLAVLLTFVVGLTLGRIETPRPWLFTILLFLLEVDILLHVRRTGKLLALAWLPAIFALWVNVHIQFIDGLLVLGLALATSFAEPWLARRYPHLQPQPKASPIWFAIALVSSLVATLVNPFGWHIYRTAYDLAAQPGVLNKIGELQALPFRDFSDFLILALTLASTAVLARARRIQIFETGLLIFAAVLSFRSQRDVWVIATATAVILAKAIGNQENTDPDSTPLPVDTFPTFAVPIALLLAMVSIPVGFRAMHIDHTRLAEVRAHDLPVDAAAFLQQHPYRGPLFNDYAWGGYLIWSLKMPVSIDGRAALYGDQRIDRSDNTFRAQSDWSFDAQLTRAGIVVTPIKAPLTQLLRLDPRFHLAYEDKLAAVFVPATTPHR